MCLLRRVERGPIRMKWDKKRGKGITIIKEWAGEGRDPMGMAKRRGRGKQMHHLIYTRCPKSVRKN